MEELIIESLAEIIEPRLLLVLAGLYVIYKQNLLLRSAVRAGLLAHITRIHDGAMAKGGISKDALRIVVECYTQYKATGGDGYADGLMSEINSLPIK